MFFLAPDQKIYDDGSEQGPAYALDIFGHRTALPPDQAARLERYYYESTSSRLPLGNAVARATKAFGMQPCEPCAARQATLNRFGDRALRAAGSLGRLVPQGWGRAPRSESDEGWWWE